MVRSTYIEKSRRVNWRQLSLKFESNPMVDSVLKIERIPLSFPQLHTEVTTLALTKVYFNIQKRLGCQRRLPPFHPPILLFNYVLM